MTALQNRIVGHADVPPADLLAHPHNFRRHPGEQRDALRGSLNELGWVKTVLVNQRTGHVIDGHARVEEALRSDQPTVPVTYVDLSEAEESKALVLLDPITGMATHDAESLSALLAQVTTTDAGVQGLLDELAHEAEMLTARATKAEQAGTAGETQNFNIQYLILFENLDEQEAWFGLLERLRAQWPDMPTVAARLKRWIVEAGADGDAA